MLDRVISLSGSSADRGCSSVDLVCDVDDGVGVYDLVGVYELVGVYDRVGVYELG